MGEDDPSATAPEAQALAERVAADVYPRDPASQVMGMRIGAVGPNHD